MGYSDRILNTTQVIQGYSGVTKYISNWVPTNDNRYMCCWFDSTSKKLQTGYSSDQGFITSNYAIESIVEDVAIVTDHIGLCQTVLYKRNDGKVLLFFISVIGNGPYTNTLYCYISNTGNGDDWAHYNTIHTITGGGTTGGIIATMPIKLSSGRLVMSAYDSLLFQGYCFGTTHVYTSDDNGASWAMRYEGSYTGDNSVSNVILLPNGYLYFVKTRGSGQAYLMRSVDNGITWNQTTNDWAYDFSDELRSPCYNWALFYDEAAQAAFSVNSSGRVSGSGVFAINWTNYQEFEDKSKWLMLTTPEFDGPPGIIYLISDYLIIQIPGSVYPSACFIFSGVLSLIRAGHNAVFCKVAGAWRRIRNLQTKNTSFLRQRCIKAKHNDTYWGRFNL